jgi:hypothetical protein
MNRVCAGLKYLFPRTSYLNASAKRSNRLSNAILVAVCVLLITRLFVLINNHAVNVLYWDQWGFYAPLFEQRSLWEHFAYQYGPHCLGIGGILVKIVAELSGWNARVEAFVVGALACLSCAAALWLKRRLLGPLTAPDVAIPLITLTLCQYQTFLGATNPYYGSLPALIFCYSITLTFKNCPAKYAAIVSLNFLILFTGYGVFIGPVTIGLLADHPASYYSVNKRNWKECYLKYEDVKKCDALPDLITDFDIGVAGAEWKLDYLKRNRINLYLDRR